MGANRCGDRLKENIRSRKEYFSNCQILSNFVNYFTPYIPLNIICHCEPRKAGCGNPLLLFLPLR